MPYVRAFPARPRLCHTSARMMATWLRVACWLTGVALTAPLSQAAVPLVQISPTVYQTEHCLFIIDASIPWSSPSAAYNALFTASGGTFPNLANYFNTLTTQFPGTYFSVCYIANTGDSPVPNYIDRIYKASGINEPGTSGAPQSFNTVDICRYNLPGGSVITPVLGVYDHEIGHAWGAQVFNFTPPTLSNGHWLSNSTVDCQLGSGDSPDGWLTVNKIYGDPINGFHWQKVDNMRNNDFETFSEQTLYLIGAAARWPTTYVLNNPIYNANLTMGFSSVDTFDHATLVATYGARNPDYTTAQKRFRLGFVYIARDLAEVNTVYQNVEKSANHFCNADAIDTSTYRAQTPFLCNTKYRASADSLLSDLDGNVTPTLTITNTYIQSADGTAVVNFTASDPDGPTPTVTVVPASTCCTISGSSVQIANQPDGVFFFTLKAVDAGGKNTYAHFVVEVHRPTSATTITTQPVGQTTIAGTHASFSVTASGNTNFLTYQWYRQGARSSTWNTLTDGNGYSGSTTPTLTIATTPAMDQDQFLCVASDNTGTATSSAAALRVNETVPTFLTQPTDRSTAAGNSVPFSVSVGGPATTFGYYAYQWQRQAAGSNTWTDLTDGNGYTSTTTATFRVMSTLAMSGDQFRCVVTNTAGAVTSNPATLTVGAIPAINTQPVSITVTAGQTATFTVVASGTAPLSYQWSLYGTPVAGGTSATRERHSARITDTRPDPTERFRICRRTTNPPCLTMSARAGEA